MELITVSDRPISHNSCRLNDKGSRKSGTFLKEEDDDRIKNNLHSFWQSEHADQEDKETLLKEDVDW